MTIKLEHEIPMQTATAARASTGRKKYSSAKAKQTARSLGRSSVGESQNLWRRLRTLREAADLKQEELADKLDLSRSAVTQWERNVTQPSLSMIERLAAIFKTTPEFLAFGLQKESKEFGTVSIPVVAFPSTGKAHAVSHIGLDRPFIEKMGITDSSGLRAFAVMDDPGLPGMRAGDRVVYDENAKRISNETQIAMMVHGEPRIAVASMIPSGGKPQARVKMGTHEHDIALDKLELLGRVVSVLHHAV